MFRDGSDPDRPVWPFSFPLTRRHSADVAILHLHQHRILILIAPGADPVLRIPGSR